MKSAPHTSRSHGINREIPEKELNEIMRTVGDKARAQTIEQKARLTDELRKELAAARAAFLGHGNQSTQA
jgi:hypothetical protein